MDANEKDRVVKSEGGRGQGRMVAPRPAPVPMQPVTELAAERNVPQTALAGMCRHYNWAEGKQLSADEFESAMTAYQAKPMGCGRI
jgi:hypothetical protein